MAGWLDARGCKGHLLQNYGLRLQRERETWAVWRYTRNPETRKVERELIVRKPDWWLAFYAAVEIARERGYRFSPENDPYGEVPDRIRRELAAEQGAT